MSPSDNDPAQGGKPAGPVIVEYEDPGAKPAPKAKARPEARRAQATPQPSGDGPVVVEVAQQGTGSQGWDPSSAPEVDDDHAPEGRAMVAATRTMARQVSWLARLFWGALLGLVLLWAGTAAWDFVFSLLERNLWLGRAALGLGALALVAVAVFCLREITALARLGRIDRIRDLAADAARDDDTEKARAATRRLATLYASREEARWGLQALREAEAETMDATTLLATAERELLTPLDAAALAEVEAACRQVATVTALVPLTLADVAVALTANLRMIRRMATIYGGRSGRLGSWRLMRAVATHLVATGAVGVADDMIGAIAGGGAVGRISRRFGEGVVNGALTARVGLAAMDVCRPLPFEARQRPGTTEVVRRALQGFFSKGS